MSKYLDGLSQQRGAVYANLLGDSVLYAKVFIWESSLNDLTLRMLVAILLPPSWPPQAFSRSKLGEHHHPLHSLSTLSLVRIVLVLLQHSRYDPIISFHFSTIKYQ